MLPRTVFSVDLSVLDLHDRRELLLQVRTWPDVQGAGFQPDSRGRVLDVRCRRVSDVGPMRAAIRRAMDSGTGAFWDRVYRAQGMAWFDSDEYMGEGGTVDRVADVVRGYLGTAMALRSGPAGVALLDVGCGPCALPVALRDYTRGGWGVDRLMYYGCDLSPAALALGHQRLAEKEPGFPWWLTARSFQSLVRQFNLVVAMHVLEHAEDPVAFCRGLRMACLPGGLVVVAGRLLGDAPPQHPKYRQNRFGQDELRWVVCGGGTAEPGVSSLHVLSQSSPGGDPGSVVLVAG